MGYEQFPQTPSLGRAQLGRFELDETLTFLNHGSFGACPKAVSAYQRTIRSEIEHDPVQFLLDELEGRLDAVRATLCHELGVSDPHCLVFGRNVTALVNAVLRSVRFVPGDEILVTDHGYNACGNAATEIAALTGAKVVVVNVPLPLRADEAVQAILSGVSSRTRLAMIDHVTSPTGLIFPIEAIVGALKRVGVETLVDGAHGPGMLNLRLDALGAAYYVGNFHKWWCAPRGSALLFVRKDAWATLRPPIISHGANSMRTDRPLHCLEYDWTGTDDPSALLSVSYALSVVSEFGGGSASAVRAHCKALALTGRRILCDALGSPPLSDESAIGTLAAVSLPPSPNVDPQTSALYPDPLKKWLYRTHKIQVLIAPWPSVPQRLVRISAFVYNEVGDYERLANALVEGLALEKKRGRLES